MADRTAFLSETSELTDAVRAVYDEDLAEWGYITNVARMWSSGPEALQSLFAVIHQVAEDAGLSQRETGILVLSTTSTLGDAYCTLGWSQKLAGLAAPELIRGVLLGDDQLLDERERALAAWARSVAADPNRTEASDVDSLRAIGLTEPQILAVTMYVALRLAYATINDALGARPDWQMARDTPELVREAITFGRPVAPEPSP